MQITERFEDPEQAQRTAHRGHQARVWTALPGLIVDFNLDNDCTATIQPAVMGAVRNPDTSVQYVNYPQLIKCPVQFPGGGGIFLTHPLAKDDEVLIIIASRCIDSWWQLGGIQRPPTLRMHDLGDGFCIPGISSVPRALPNISLTSTQIRTRELVMLDISPTLATFNVPVLMNEGLEVIGTGTATVDFVSNGKSGHNHEHMYNPGDNEPTNTAPPT